MFQATHRAQLHIARLFLAILFPVLLIGCSEQGVEPLLPDNTQQSTTLAKGHVGLERAMEVQDRHTERFLEQRGVVGTGTGLTEEGLPAVIIFTEKHIPDGQLPAELEGIPVIQYVSGKMTPTSAAYAAKGKPTGSKQSTSTTVPSPASQFSRPVPIGVSTSNWNECSAGTIGVRVRSGENYYVLSCNHVFARCNLASIGEKILQPGRSDQSCSQSASNEIGQVVDFQPLAPGFNNSNIMDAALVSTTPALISNTTPQDGYGVPSSTTATAYIGMEVQKYGRTTGLTKGKVYAVNTTVVLNYGIGPMRFTNQIVFVRVRKKAVFVDGGDSGSLLVTDDANANPVGIIYGKSSSFACVAPIDPILTRFNVQIDGK